MTGSRDPYVTDWLRIAEKDLARVDRMLDAADFEAAAFYLQQAIEKFMKAFLLSKGWSLRRIHDLEILLNDAVTHDASLEQYRALCQRVTGFYFLERYPVMAAAEVSDEDVRDALTEALALIERLNGGLAT